MSKPLPKARRPRLERDTKKTTRADVRAWVEARLPLDRATLERFGLERRARRHFGSWRAAVSASSPSPSKPTSVRALPSDRREAILRLFGLVPDATIARVTGERLRQLGAVRRWLGLRSAYERGSRTRDRPRRVQPKAALSAATLADVRGWNRAGLPRDRATLSRFGLWQRARRHFGSWDTAAAAAGVYLRPSVVRVPSDRVGAADLLATLVDGRTLARLTGRPLWDARARQTWLGQDRDTRQARIAIDSGWLGKLPDQEVADRLRIHRPLIARAREQLGVEAPRRPRGLGARLRASPEMTARIALDLSTLSPRERKIVRARALDWPQRTLGDLGRELGLTRERVRQIDARALRTLGVLPV